MTTMTRCSSSRIRCWQQQWFAASTTTSRSTIRNNNNKNNNNASVATNHRRAASGMAVVQYTVAQRKISNIGSHCRFTIPFQRCMISPISTLLRSSSRRRFSGSSSSSIGDSCALYCDQIPPDVMSIVEHYARQPPTLVSLQTLLQTGRGSGCDTNTVDHPFFSNSSSQNNLANHHDNRGGVGSNGGGGDMPTPRLWGRLGERLASERILIQMAAYLRHELPIRLAHRIQDLDQVPYMRDMEAVQAVKGIYVHSFLKLIDFPLHIQNLPDEQAFAELLAPLYQKHAGVLVQMAQGAYQLREETRKQQKEQRRIIFRKAHMLWGNSKRDGNVAESNDHGCFERMEECHQFLDRFYMSRIGIRFLAAQYLTLRSTNTSSINDPQAHHQSSQHQAQQYIGMICQQTSPSQCVRQAAADASMMCRRTYGRCPRVEVTGRLDLTFPYIPTYLHYILLELLKNALRATMEAHLHDLTLPVVNVVIADDTENEDVVIKIADEGGGIPRSQVDKIWSYLFTTADPKIQESFVGDKADSKDHGKEAPMAGLGYGLPIARSYCRYFGGELDLISMEGFGTDAFVHLKRLGDSNEPVPL